MTNLIKAADALQTEIKSLETQLLWLAEGLRVIARGEVAMWKDGSARKTARHYLEKWERRNDNAPERRDQAVS